jgi:hypothetical protein
MRKKKTLYGSYHFSGFTPQRSIIGIFGDPAARVIKLDRRGKKQHAVCAARSTDLFTTIKSEGSVTFPVATRASIWNCRYGASCAGVVAR